MKVGDALDRAAYWEKEFREEQLGEGDARLNCIVLAEEIERLRAKVALLEHEADCHWCEICSPGYWTSKQCPECGRLQKAVKAAETEGGER